VRRVTGRRTIVPLSTSDATPQASSEPPAAIQIRVGEAARGPLARAATAFARSISSAGEALYDYSGGHYGLQPLDAKEVRHERQKQRDRAERVAVVEVREQPGERQPRGWLPVAAAVLGVVVGASAIAIWQRRRLQAAATQAVERGKSTAQQLQQQMAARTGRSHPVRMPGPMDRVPTPTFDRVVRGELLAPGTAPVAPPDGMEAPPPRTPGRGATGADAVSD
jgi:hypothetical protein